MKPQYLAAEGSCTMGIEALASQVCRLHSLPYVFASDCSMVSSRNTQVSLTSETGRVRQSFNARPTHIHRRHRCRRASNSWQPSVLSPLFLHAQVARAKKNTLLLRQSRSRLSQHTQVSTSKLTAGQAYASAPTPLGWPYDRRAV